MVASSNSIERSLGSDRQRRIGIWEDVDTTLTINPVKSMKSKALNTIGWTMDLDWIWEGLLSTTTSTTTFNSKQSQPVQERPYIAVLVKIKRLSFATLLPSLPP
uniref:Uncharacterized protein n=1 Tax=Lepeophtheirus salmonis TaxID=72036 RepID=A0A0K2TQD9_LEPSM